MAPRRPRRTTVSRPAGQGLTAGSSARAAARGQELPRGQERPHAKEQPHAQEVGLADFTAETFAGRIGEPFRTSDADGQDHDLVLERCVVAPLEWRASTAGRTPFSLYFLGPRDPLLPQRTYDVRHADLGAFQLFIVPTSRDAEATRYEAVFN